MTESEAIKIIENTPIFRYEADKTIHSDLFNALAMGCKALEKQIPKKPIEMKPTDKLMNGYYSCPICGGWVGMDEYSNNYCGNCGQAIDWSDEE